MTERPDERARSESGESASPASVETRTRELAFLGAIATALNARVDLAGTLETALTRVIELLELEAGWIWLLDPETGEPYLAVAHNLPPGLAEEPATMEGPCWCLDALAGDRLDPATNIGVLKCSRLAKLTTGTGGYSHHASVPLEAHGHKLGLLNVATAEWRELDEHSLRLLHTVSGLLGIAIERSRLYEASVRLGTVEERNRLAREFHDTLAQSLVAAAQQLEMADALLEGGGSEDPAVARAHAAITRALTLTRGTIEETRRSVHDLRGTSLDGRTLAEALGMEVDAFRTRTGTEVTFTTVGTARPLPSRVEAALMRIGQETLANVERHAGATAVEVDLTASPTALELRVRDDGCGFDPDEVASAASDRFGLVGMNERARLLGGTFRVASAPGDGTEVVVTVPLVDGDAPGEPVRRGDGSGPSDGGDR